MAVFEAMQLTAAGMLLMSKVQTGELLHFTRIVAGDGTKPVGAITDIVNAQSELTALSAPYLSNPFAQLDVKLVADTLTGFMLREIFVYADDPDLGEIPYAYAYAESLGTDWVPPLGSAWAGAVFQILMRIDNATNVTCYIGTAPSGGIIIVPKGNTYPVPTRHEFFGYLFITDGAPSPPSPSPAGIFFALPSAPANSNLTGRQE